jgi:type IV secretory pathway TraG/TraD family ATPase VirD4
MMSLFGAKVVMSGIADKHTLEQLSLICGDYDREIQTLTETDHISPFSGHRDIRESWTTRREPRLPADEIARLPKGKALVIVGSDWWIVPTLPYHQHPNFAHVTHRSAPIIEATPDERPTPGPHQNTAPDGGLSPSREAARARKQSDLDSPAAGATIKEVRGRTVFAAGPL